MVSDQNLANAIGGKTARACDNCIRKRARWFCAADDAFLCQACDSSVHSANSLARRHERVRLKIASLKSFDESRLVNLLPPWQKGFTKKPRTPRRQEKHGVRAKSKESARNFLHLVPEIGADENSIEENEEQEQLLYRVPIFDPFVEQIVENNGNERDDFGGHELKGVLQYDCDNGVNSSNGFEPSDMDLADFAADVETLLGKGLDEESFDMEGLGLLDYKEKGSVKVEDEEDMEALMADHVDTEIDMTREPFELNFDFESPEPSGEEVEKVVAEEAMENNIEEYKVSELKKRKILLRLDFEGVLNAWADQRSPWTTGDRPVLNSGDCWPDCLGSCGAVHNPYVDLRVVSGHSANLMVDGGREARVSRYREKRRTRLFSKKIRYEVRKLNAEKRPRMKGRFVKRSNFAGPGFSLLSK